MPRSPRRSRRCSEKAAPSLIFCTGAAPRARFLPRVGSLRERAEIGRPIVRRGRSARSARHARFRSTGLYRSTDPRSVRCAPPDNALVIAAEAPEDAEIVQESRGHSFAWPAVHWRPARAAVPAAALRPVITGRGRADDRERCHRTWATAARPGESSAVTTSPCTRRARSASASGTASAAT
jgi:hypothetical protein